MHRSSRKGSQSKKGLKVGGEGGRFLRGGSVQSRRGGGGGPPVHLSQHPFTPSEQLLRAALSLSFLC